MKNLIFKQVILLFFCTFSVLSLSGCGGDSVSFSEMYQQQKQLESGKNNYVVDGSATPDPSASTDKQDQKSTKQQAKDTVKNLNKKGASDYDKLMEKVTNQGNSDMSATELLWYYWYSVLDIIKKNAALIIIFSEMIGGFLFFVFKGNKSAQKWALFGLCIGVPVTVIFLIFGVGILNGVISG